MRSFILFTLALVLGGDALADATFTPPPAASAAVTLAPDWAADDDATIVAGDWVSVSTLGGATSVYKAARSLGLRVRTDLASDGATAADGNRVQGLAHAVPAGDFIVGIRLTFDRPGVAVDATTTAIAAVVMFIDGVNSDTAAWYGVGNYYSGVGVASPSVLRFANDGGADRFETYASFGTILNAPGVGAGPYDAFLVRSGTTLDVYLGPAGGSPPLVYSWTVTAGAGYVGLRIQHQLDVAHDLQALILAFRSFSAVPW